MTKKYTHDEIVIKAKMVHGDRYMYHYTYDGMYNDWVVTCSVHGEFTTKPNRHINRGTGCPDCAGNKRLTRTEFISRAVKVHGDRYEYGNVEYINQSTPVIIKCILHGDFEQSPDAHICQASGCPECANCCRALSHQRYMQLVSKVHGDMYAYTEYNHKSDKQQIICNIHGVFNQSLHAHIYQQQGCPYCAAGAAKLSQSEFEERAHTIHSNKFTYGVYTNANVKMEICCPYHGIFTQKPNDHLKGHGCKHCVTTGYSKAQIEWLLHIASQQNININHAENGGEYLIPSTNYRADGYCSDTNTIYEFHGDAFHGNPKRYAPDTKCHPFNDNVTALELHTKTLEKESRIRELGYNLVVMWESDWLSFKKQIQWGV